MSSRRREASDPATSADRLRELTLLEGDRGDIDSDAGWCREFVASNPSAAAETLTELARDSSDHLVRLGAARNPSTPAHVLVSLTEDPNDLVANAARSRTGLPARAAAGCRIPGTHFSFDPATGQVIGTR